jgi:hypothetical protein
MEPEETFELTNTEKEFIIFALRELLKSLGSNDAYDEVLDSLEKKGLV